MVLPVAPGKRKSFFTLSEDATYTNHKKLVGIYCGATGRSPMHQHERNGIGIISIPSSNTPSAVLAKAVSVLIYDHNSLFETQNQTFAAKK